MHIVAAPSQHTAPTTHTSPTAILKSKTIGPGINHRSPSTTTNNNKDGKIPIHDDDDYDTRKDDSQGKRRSLPPIVMTMLASLMSKVQRSCSNWNGNIDFIQAQGQVALVLIVAYIGNNWPYSYPRNDNHNYTMFWSMNMAVLIAAACTMKHVPNTRGIQILSRSQTEEWKGWMQWAFIMYHYYRAYNVYNTIRVFVSSYVWMTGFGNFLYFDKKADFSIERAVSMWIRINYFPILLSVFVGVPFDLLYIVPLHTTAFFITMITCYVAKQLEIRFNFPHWKRNGAALTACMVIHILFYETPIVNTLRFLFGKEILFRFQSDKYSAVLGIISGYFWNRAQSFVTWAHTPTTTPTGFNNPTLPDPTDGKTAISGGDATTLTPYFTPDQQMAIWGQRVGGVLLIALWWNLFGHISDKFTYNPMHPFVFWLPVFGWLMIRNSSKYMTEVHSTALEFFGKITLETYVLQFHVFMCQNVQHIPIVIPGSGPDGHWIIKFCNMLLTGIGFVALAYWARKITVTTQTTVTDFLVLCMGNGGSSNGNSSDVAAVEKVPLTNNVDTADEESHPNVTVEITNGGLTHKSSDLDAATGK